MSKGRRYVISVHSPWLEAEEATTRSTTQINSRAVQSTQSDHWIDFHVLLLNNFRRRFSIKHTAYGLTSRSRLCKASCRHQHDSGSMMRRQPCSNTELDEERPGQPMNTSESLQNPIAWIRRCILVAPPRRLGGWVVS